MFKPIAAAALVAIACVAHAQPPAEGPLQFTALQVRATGPQGGAAIVGSAVNVSAKSLTTVLVTFNLYDQQENLVGNAYATVNGLEPGRQWRFEAPAAPGFASFKLAQVLSN